MQKIAFYFGISHFVIEIADLAFAAGDAHGVDRFFHQLRILFRSRQSQQFGAAAGDTQAVKGSLLGFDAAASLVNLHQGVVVPADAEIVNCFLLQLRMKFTGCDLEHQIASALTVTL